MIDTPPALSILTINAYTAADKLIIPMIAEILSLQGIAPVSYTHLDVYKRQMQRLYFLVRLHNSISYHFLSNVGSSVNVLFLACL